MKKITNRIPKWIDWAAQALVAFCIGARETDK